MGMWAAAPLPFQTVLLYPEPTLVGFWESGGVALWGSHPHQNALLGQPLRLILWGLAKPRNTDLAKAQGIWCFYDLGSSIVSRTGTWLFLRSLFGKED